MGTYSGISFNSCPIGISSSCPIGCPTLNHGNPVISYNKSGHQDRAGRNPNFSISKSVITLYGNSWKCIKLPAPIQISDKTTLEFDFSLPQIAEVHAICLEDNLSYSKSFYKHCFHLGGTQNVKTGFDFVLLNDDTPNRGSKHYKIN